MSTDRRRTSSSALRLGALMWVVQPLYVLAEVLTAATVTAPYSFLDNTISDLGATTCTSIAYPFGHVPVCSPWHLFLNGSFIGFGLLLAAGAVLLRSWLPRGPVATASVTLWAVSGLSPIAAGLVPLDQDPKLHAVVSLPVFLAQPLALFTTAVALRHHRTHLAGSALFVAIMSLVGTIAFLGRLNAPDLGGLFERLALWPAHVWLPLLALAVLRNPSSIRPEAASGPRRAPGL